MEKYFDETISILEQALCSIDEVKFEKLIEESVNTLKKGKKIIVSGLGKNVPICDKFVGTMISLGLEAYFLHTNSAVHGDMGIIKEGDMVLILTKSGETAESIYLTRKIMERKTDLWLLSFEENSTLTREIKNHLIINLEHEGDMWNVVPNNSTTLYLIILQTLAINIAKKLNIQLEEFRKNHPGGHIGEMLKEN